MRHKAEVLSAAGLVCNIAEKRWETKSGFEALVTFADGHRCGYVRIPEKHWARYIDDTDTIETKVHGGISYNGVNPTIPKIPDLNGYWLGFDCNHQNDDKCPDWIEKKGWSGWWVKEDNKIHRTLDYCVEQCELLASELSGDQVFKSAQHALNIVREYHMMGIDNGVIRAILYLDSYLNGRL